MSIREEGNIKKYNGQRKRCGGSAGGGRCGVDITARNLPYSHFNQLLFKEH